MRRRSRTFPRRTGEVDPAGMSEPQANDGTLFGIHTGDVIDGRYEIVRVLGVGGTGAVFEAKHKAIGRTVAIKFLLPELAINPTVPARFLHEARTANQVRHRNIVEVIDFGNDRGRLYLVMEYLRGESLAAFIKHEAPTAPGRILAVMDPILAALSYAHTQGIIHRDIKPQNLFLSVQSDGEIIPKVIDFGIARRIVTEDVRLTSTGMILGTPAYMAPEQAQGASDVTSAADQYALGAILYQALTGQIPIAADTYPAMLIALATQRPRVITELRADLDPALARIVMKMLVREPAARFASLDAVRAAIKPFIDPRALQATHIDPARTRPDGTPPVLHGSAPTPIGYPGSSVLVSALEEPIPATSALPWASIAPILGAGVFILAAMSLAVVLAVRHPRHVAPVSAEVPMSPRQINNSVTFQVDVDPPVAAITLDGALVGHGHAEVLRPRDGRRYQLLLTAPGRGDVTDVLVANSDARVSRVLPDLSPSVYPIVIHPADMVRSSVPRAPTSAWTDPMASHTDSRHPHIDRNNPFRP